MCLVLPAEYVWRDGEFEVPKIARDSHGTAVEGKLHMWRDSPQLSIPSSAVSPFDGVKLMPAANDAG